MQFSEAEFVVKHLFFTLSVLVFITDAVLSFYGIFPKHPIERNSTDHIKELSQELIMVGCHYFSLLIFVSSQSDFSKKFVCPWCAESMGNPWKNH